MINRVLQALQKPESYDEDVKEIRLIQTHISFVFLTGDYVYKIKKPVNFGFLDFTTLEKRKFYCEEEMRVNKALVGDIYLGVVPIVETPEGRIKVNDMGRVVEYAVKMIQLPQSAIMSNLLKENNIYKKDVAEIAKLVADFHSTANIGEEINKYGSYEQIMTNWTQNFEQTENLTVEYLDKEKYLELKDRVINFMDSNKELFERRVREGKIRECHGDLHSGNIFIVRRPGKLYKSGIYIFDAIEFFKGFSCSDVLADIAFLSMDLEFNGRDYLDKSFIDAYFEFSDEEKLENLLDFYKCYRAFVRMKVTGFMLFDENVDEEEKIEIRGLVKKYFELAGKYATLLSINTH